MPAAAAGALQTSGGDPRGRPDDVAHQGVKASGYVDRESAVA